MRSSARCRYSAGISGSHTGGMGGPLLWFIYALQAQVSMHVTVWTGDQTQGHLPFTTGNPFWGTKLLGFSIGRGSGALKGLTGDVLFFFSFGLLKICGRKMFQRLLCLIS